jgi:site-specific DNA recombinase
MIKKDTSEWKPGMGHWLTQLQQAGKKQAIREGHYQGGAVPYGYKRVYDSVQKRFILELSENESSVVKQIFREYLRVKSLGKLAERLTESGVMNRQNKPWSRAALGYLISNEAYLGKVKYGELKAMSKHESIIAPIVFNKVQVVKRDNNKRG